MKLLNVDSLADVREKLSSHFGGMTLKTESVGIDDAAGRYIAEEIHADMDMPQFRRSVVDGYAVCASDTFGAGDAMPAFLNIAGTVEMGSIYEDKMRPGEAVYVPTGGMIPDGADAMVMIEFVDKLDERTVAVYKPSAPNSGIMNIGDDFRKDELFFARGHRLKPKDIGMLAACGKTGILVYRKPLVSIISTGDELVDASETPGPGQIRDINGRTLAAFAKAAGAEIQDVRVFRDDFDACRTHAAKQLENSDIVLISGGSSAGNKDMTAALIDSLGDPGVITHGIAIKPGKPTIIGNVGGKPVFGLPGHPVSAVAVFAAVVEPFIKSRYFGSSDGPVSVSASVTENIHAGEGRETYQMVILEKTGSGWLAEPIRAKSGAISQLMRADGYIRIGSLTEGIEAGTAVEVFLL